MKEGSIHYTLRFTNPHLQYFCQSSILLLTPPSARYPCQAKKNCLRGLTKALWWRFDKSIADVTNTMRFTNPHLQYFCQSSILLLTPPSARYPCQAKKKEEKGWRKHAHTLLRIDKSIATCSSHHLVLSSWQLGRFKNIAFRTAFGWDLFVDFHRRGSSGKLRVGEAHTHSRYTHESHAYKWGYSDISNTSNGRLCACVHACVLVFWVSN